MTILSAKFITSDGVNVRTPETAGGSGMSAVAKVAA